MTRRYVGYTETAANALLDQYAQLGLNVQARGAAGDGTTDDYAAIAAVSSDLGSEGRMFFPPGTYRIGTNLTINCEAIFALGATLEPDAGVTVTLAGPVTTAPGASIIASTALGTVSITGPTNGSGVLDVRTFGAVGDGVTDDTAAIQAAIDTLSLGGTVIFPKATYRISAAIEIGFNVKLIGNGSTLLQATDDTPGIIIGSSRWVVTGFIVRYATQQTTAETQAYGILLDNAFEGILENLIIQRAFYGVGVNNRDLFDGDAFAYMVMSRNVRAEDCASWGFYFNNDGNTGMTTNCFDGCYAVQSANNNANTSSAGFYIGFHTGGVSLRGCAVDKVQSRGMLIASCTGVFVDAMDFESSVITNQALVSVDSSNNVFLNVIAAANTFAGTTAYVVRVTGTSRNVVINGREGATTNNAGTLYGVSGESSNSAVRIEAYDFISDAGLARQDLLISSGKRQIFSYNLTRFAREIGSGKREEWRSAAPTTGPWLVGDITWNTAPAAGGTIGWVCTTAGTPGTWKTWGNIAP